MVLEPIVYRLSSIVSANLILAVLSLYVGRSPVERMDFGLKLTLIGWRETILTHSGVEVVSVPVIAMVEATALQA